MKFEEQVASYYSKLRRRSRFFSSLMLVSGISLAAAAPFLSYEVSQIECAEKGSVVTQDFSDELQTLKNELEGKDETITVLEREVEDKNEEVSKLADNLDCDNLLRGLENDKDRLIAELTEATAESAVKDEAITVLEREVVEKTEEISNLASNPDCENLVRVIEKERDRLAAELKEATGQSLDMEESISRLKDMLGECQEQLELTSNLEQDCEKYTEEINKLQETITTKDRTITRLRGTLQETVTCPTISLSGTFRYDEEFTFNGNEFVVAWNTDDVGAEYKFMHNSKDVSSKVKSVNKSRIYTFTDRSKDSYQITFGEVVKTGVLYSLASQ